MNAKQEALKILEAQRRAKERLLALNNMRARRKSQQERPNEKSDAEHTKTETTRKETNEEPFQNMERFKRDAIVSGEQMGCELCELVAIECFKEFAVEVFDGEKRV